MICSFLSKHRPPLNFPLSKFNTEELLKREKMNENNLNTEDRFNNERSNAYDELIMKVIPGYHASHELARYLLEDFLRSSSKVLVAGCGVGTVSKKQIDSFIKNFQHILTKLI